MERKPAINTDHLVRNNWNSFLDVVNNKLEAIGIKDLDPNVVTAIGGASGLLSAYFVSEGKFGYARAAYATAGLADATDGYVARKNGKESTFGAFFDSVLDRVVDFSMLLGMEKHARAQGWDFAAEMAAVSRPLVAGPALLRMIGETYDVKMPEQAWGSRLARTAATTACIVHPTEKTWNIGLGYIAAASGITTYDRFSALSENPESIATAWEQFDEWGKLRRMGTPREIADLNLINSYVAGKADLVTKGNFKPSPSILPLDEREMLMAISGPKSPLANMLAMQDAVRFAGDTIQAFKAVYSGKV